MVCSRIIFISESFSVSCRVSHSTPETQLFRVDFTHIRRLNQLKVKRVETAHAMKKTIKATKRNIIGARVRLARLKHSPAVSQDDLAGKLAAQGIVMDRTAVSRIENQSRYAMDYEAAAIARALKISVAWLFGE
jgi:hypothetical protein